MQTCFPIATPTFSYIMNGIILDTPYQATGQALAGGNLQAGGAFLLMWQSASTATKNALANGAVGTMTFAEAGGSKITALVKVASTLVGSLFIATCTVTAVTPIDYRVIPTQFY
jgi:hypothetical protein